MTVRIASPYIMDRVSRTVLSMANVRIWGSCFQAILFSAKPTNLCIRQDRRGYDLVGAEGLTRVDERCKNLPTLLALRYEPRQTISTFSYTAPQLTELGYAQMKQWRGRDLHAIDDGSGL